jgi:2-polyprenyl-3-methyl-5-hydroxy-6-metoxy-1,4-benzoquinol methylase
MDSGEREAWTKIITAEDLDFHLDSVGQAKTNAEIIKLMLKENPLKKEDVLLIPGCGTGQFLDYISPKDLGDNIHLIFTDINEMFLEKVKERTRKIAYPIYKYQIDDIEDSKLKEKIKGVLIVLVLEHVEWKKALKSMISLNPKTIYIIAQKQGPGQRIHISQTRKLRPSIEEYCKLGSFKIVDREELIHFMKENNFIIKKIYNKPVPDNKLMVGYVFEKI